jgi:hypothetical protein
VVKNARATPAGRVTWKAGATPRREAGGKPLVVGSRKLSRFSAMSGDDDAAREPPMQAGNAKTRGRATGSRNYSVLFSQILVSRNSRKRFFSANAQLHFP